MSHEVSVIKDINRIIVGGTYNERNRKRWETVRVDISKIYVSFVGELLTLVKMAVLRGT